MRKLLVILSVLGILGAAAGGMAFIYIDRLVVSRLSRSPSESARAAIYAEALRIDGQKTTEAILRERFVARSYREVEHLPKSPGEYRFKNGSADIFVRSFNRGDGNVAPAMNVRLNLQTGVIRSEQGEAVSPVALEPLVIAELGAGAIKATQYRALAEIPQIVKDAVTSVEDERFYNHFGIDLFGLLRATWQNIRAGRLVQGGSTITQQYVKNTLFSPRRTLGRKLREILAAVSLELHLSKDEILERYLNEVYLGQEGSVAIHGVAEAAAAFFGKGIESISTSEAALLAGIIRAPSSYSPRRHLKRAVARRDVALAKLLELEKISPAAYRAAKSSKVTLVATPRHRMVAPYFVAALQQHVESEMVATNGSTDLSAMSIYTPLNYDYQRCAERAVALHAARIEREIPRSVKRTSQPEIALVSLETFTGKVRSWVGGRNFAASQFNRVSQSQRQVGSTIKPFLYLTALDRNLNRYKIATALSILSDRPLHVDLVTQQTWEPENYDHEYRGDVTLRYALEHSLNMPAVYVGQRVTPPALAETLKKFRLGEKLLPVPSLALGALDTSLLHLTSAYGALANGGLYVPPQLYLAVVDTENQTVLRPPISEERIADESAVYVLTSILQGVLDRGTATVVRNMGFRGDAAGKTGTSNEARDAWFVAFTPELVTGVWVGFDDNRPLGLTGGKAAAPIWAEYMQCIAPFRSANSFVAPPGVVVADVDRKTGQRAGPECPKEDVFREVFVSGTEPTVTCQRHNDDAFEEQRYDREDTLDAPDSAPAPAPRRRRGFWDTVFGESE